MVVNNAGYGDVAPYEQLSPERFKAVVDTNFYGVVYMTRAALPIMRKQKSGYILQISSVGGRLALHGSTPYHAAMNHDEGLFTAEEDRDSIFEVGQRVVVLRKNNEFFPW